MLIFTKRDLKLPEHTTFPSQACILRLPASQTGVKHSFKCSSLLTSQLRCNSWNERTHVNWAISRTTINLSATFCESTARPACLNLPPVAHRRVCRCETLEKEQTFQLYPIIFHWNIVPMFKLHIFNICNSIRNMPEKDAVIHFSLTSGVVRGHPNCLTICFLSVSFRSCRGHTCTFHSKVATPEFRAHLWSRNSQPSRSDRTNTTGDVKIQPAYFGFHGDHFKLTKSVNKRPNKATVPDHSCPLNCLTAERVYGSPIQVLYPHSRYLK